VAPADEERCTRFAEPAQQGETMMTADSLQLPAYGQQIPVTREAIPDATSFQIADSRF
jgi:hypothetical protein